MQFNPDGLDLAKIWRIRTRELLGLILQGETSTEDICTGTGLSREKVLRVLGELQEQGFVEARDDYTMGPHRVMWSSVTDLMGIRKKITRKVLLGLIDEWGGELLDVIEELLAERPAMLQAVRNRLCPGI